MIHTPGMMVRITGGNSLNNYKCSDPTPCLSKSLFFSFKTKQSFNELSVNIVGSYLKSFNVYLADKDPSSSNTLPAEAMLFNGYRFNIKNIEDKKGLNSGTEYELIVDNREEKQNILKLCLLQFISSGSHHFQHIGLSPL